MAHELIAVHTLKSGGQYRPPGTRVTVPSKQEADYLVALGAARWPEVSRPAEAAIEASEFPEDFPGRAPLIAAGITTFAQLEAVEDLTAVSGIGKATAERISAALAARAGAKTDGASEKEEAGAATDEGEANAGGENDADGEDEDDPPPTQAGEPGISAIEA